MTELERTPADEAASMAPYGQARVNQLMYDIEHNPAVSCPISYNWRGGQELADRVSIKIQLYAQLMRETCPESY